MALTDDQRAMLRLLAQNDDSYEDIAALKGVGVEQVRAEVKAALAAAAAEEEGTPEPAAEPPKPAEPAAEPEPPSSPPQPEPKEPKEPLAPRKAGAAVPPERRRLLLLTAGAVAIVGIVLVAIALIGGGSGSSSSSSPAEGTPTLASAEGGASKKLTQAELKPVDGSDAKGQAVFGRLQKKIVLLVEAVGLEPSKQGQSYTIWLYKSPKLAVRVASVKVTKSGGMRVPVQLTSEIFAAVLARVFDRINVSRTEDAAYEREVAQAKKQGKLPPYTGETVLSGEVTGPVLKTGKGSASPGS